jgi:ADP-heptose:LPS heptosyltransferase
VKPRILVIRGGAIGDFILTLPAIRLLREAFPSAHLEILGYKHIIALAEGRTYADSTRSIEYGAMAGFFVPGAELASDLADYFASFQQIVSYLYDPSGFFEGNLRRVGAKNILRAFSTIDDSEHAARQLARPLQRLALYLDDHAAAIHPSPEDHAVADRFFHGAKRPLIAVHPGSGSARKNWPVEKWSAVAAALRKRKPEPQFVLVGGEADEVQLAGFARGTPTGPLLVARHLPLTHLAAVLQRCQFFLGHDSGISHLAAAVGAPSLLLFGPTDTAIWAPANSSTTILEAPEGDLSRLDVERVVEAAIARLGE